LRYHALIPASGTGARFGAESPKQYVLLEGKPLLLHAIERLAASIPLQMTYVVLAENDRWFERVMGRLERVTALRCGGKTRAETVRNGLDALAGVAADDWIVVHDAVRPCVDAVSLLRLQQELADDAVGGLLAIPVVCALKRADGNNCSVRTEPREGLWLAQTPQMFRYRVLREAFARPGVEHCVDESQAVEALGARPRLVAGNANNLKVSYPEDLRLAAAILAAERGAKT
jgi:2-C-methyl-D-erythritol 4-phosphate cytidylyltransferase